MEIYAFATQMEKQGEEHYRGLADKTNHAGLKSIMGMLADAKAKHGRLFQCLGRSEKAEIGDALAMDEAKAVFRRMKEEKDGRELPDIEMYRAALEMERRSIAQYREKADQLVDGPARTSLLTIAREEEKHFAIVEEILEFMERPSSWLENPEWYHLDEY